MVAPLAPRDRRSVVWVRPAAIPLSVGSPPDLGSRKGRVTCTIL